MTPKEKAKELVDKYKEFTENQYAEPFHDAKQCALIAVDEIIKADQSSVLKAGEYTFTSHTILGGPDYWEQVKIEIQKL
jgi:hypothetical protein